MFHHVFKTSASILTSANWGMRVERTVSAPTQKEDFPVNVHQDLMEMQKWPV